MKRVLMACALVLGGCYVEEVPVQNGPPPPPPPPVQYAPPPQAQYVPPPSDVPPPQQPAYVPPPADVPPPQPTYVPPPQDVPPEQAYVPPPADVAPPVDDSADYPDAEPAAVAVEFAPPPIIIEPQPMSPFYGAVWLPGYWAWDGGWRWAHGRWGSPPQPGWCWNEPYYEHRNGEVIYVGGHWRPPGSVFVPPPASVYVPRSPWRPRPGVVMGARASGPSGRFVPPPP